MNKKVSTVVISAVCLILMGAVAVGVLYKNGIITFNNLYTQAKTAEGVSSSASASGTQTKRYRDVLLKKGAEYTLQHTEGKSVADTKHYDMIFKINNIEITKKRGNFDKCEDWDEKKDSVGNITNNYSYVVVSLTILDKCEKDHIFGVNSIGLVLGKDARFAEELRAYNSKEIDAQIDPGDKDYFILYLKPNHKYNFNLAYILKDDAVEKYKNDMMVHCNSGDRGRIPPSFQDLPLVDSKGNITTMKESSHD